MSAKKLWFLGVVMALATAGNVWVALRPRRAAAPEPPLSKAQRASLDDRMGRHGDDMTDLLFAMVMLDHGTAEQLAGALADAPLPASTAAGPRFQHLHDQLRARAREAAAAAHTRDDARLTAAYGRLAGSCVDCHRVYLRGGDM